ncbi:hypothetical protein BC941DRAFT_461962 [Chlamydoabsidia padenii]|nr:hypothetical protein BC941DRAFT_461962 [Chlamydoabsidia padenii]
MAKSTKKVQEEKPADIVESSSSDEASSDAESVDNSQSDASSDQEGSDNSSDEEEEKEEEESNKRAASEEEEEEEEDKPEAKRAKVEISREVKPQFGADGLSLFVGQLDWNCTQDQLRAFFEDNGKTVTNVRISMDRNQRDDGVKRNRGFGYVDFATAEDLASARELNGTEFQGRNIRIDDATPAPRRQKDENYSTRTSTVFVANIARSLDEAGLREAFESFGTITDVRLPVDRETEQIRGFGYIQFETEDQAEKAVKEMNGVSVNGRPLRTDFSGGPNSDRNQNNGGGRGGRGGGFRGGRGGRGNFGGDRGGRGNGFRGGRGRGGFRGK